MKLKMVQQLENVLQKTNSYKDALKQNIKTTVTDIDDTETGIETEIDDDSIDQMMESVVSKNIIRTVNFDNRYLSMTFKEYLIYCKISNIATQIDNFVRILLPIIFFIIIIIIFSYK